MLSASGVYNVPKAHDYDPLNVDAMEGAAEYLTQARYIDNVFDLRTRTLGPMPAQQFLDHFLPDDTAKDRKAMRSSRHAFKSVPYRTDASTMRHALVSALNNRTKHKSRCPGFTFHGPDPPLGPLRSLADAPPDICCYAESNLPAVLEEGSAPDAGLGFVELFIEVKPDPADDYFVDPSPDADASIRDKHHIWSYVQDQKRNFRSDLAFGKHITYIAEIFARQHRTCVYTLTLHGSLMRIFRWERTGCVVTECFDIRHNPEIFCEFLWRFSLVPTALRGHDTTVRKALPEEEDAFREAVTTHVRSQLSVEGQELEAAIAIHYLPARVFVMKILPQYFSTDPENVRRFIISRPVVTPKSLIGRGTRGYWALEVSSGRLVFLKDTWRHDHSTAELEGDVLRRLSDLGVRNVPSLVWHGDVPRRFPNVTRRLHTDEYQVTLTDSVLSHSWVCFGGPDHLYIARRQHYRLITTPVGYTLRNVRGAEEILHATYDVFVAMRDALEKDSRIHRDISVGNVILVQEANKVRHGYLIDWEGSCKVDSSGESLTAGRVGTWAFASIRMVHVPVGNVPKQRFKDDMESLLYVVLYCALRWQPHKYTQKEVSKVIAVIFDDAREMYGRIVGGMGKIANAAYRIHTESLQLDSTALQEWLTTVMNFHKPTAELRDEYRDKWTAENLDEFWKTFIQTHSLESDNRSVHTLDVIKSKLEYSSLDGDFRMVTQLGSSSAREAGPSKRDNPQVTWKTRDSSFEDDSGTSSLSMESDNPVQSGNPAVAAGSPPKRLLSRSPENVGRQGKRARIQTPPIPPPIPLNQATRLPVRRSQRIKKR